MSVCVYKYHPTNWGKYTGVVRTLGWYTGVFDDDNVGGVVTPPQHMGNKKVILLHVC